jgi:hypothetical protein
VPTCGSFGSLRTWLERAEGGAGRVSAVAFGAGTVSVAMQMLLQTLQIAAVTGGASGSDAGGAALFARVGWALSVVAYVPFAVLVAATAVVSLRHRALPTWIGWFSALVAGAHIVMFIGIAADSGPLVPGGALTYVLYGLALVWLISVTTVIVVGERARSGWNAVNRPDRRSGPDELTRLAGRSENRQRGARPPARDGRWALAAENCVS